MSTLGGHEDKRIRTLADELAKSVELITEWVDQQRNKEKFKKRVEAVRSKVEENRYKLVVNMPIQELNSYQVEFVGTYSDVKKRFAAACKNLREGKMEYGDVAGLADHAEFKDWAEGYWKQTYNLEGFNQLIKKVEKDYKP